MYTIVLAVIGLFLGSFAGATVWRIRAGQLREDAKAGEKPTPHEAREVSKLPKKSILEDRSVCLHCGHTLHWFDLVPIVSWLSTSGNCRYCGKRIGLFEPMIELGMALFFVVSFVFWPMDLSTVSGVTHLVIWLVAGVGMAILFAYDAKWYLLPDKVMFPVLGVGLINAAVVLYEHDFALATLMDIVYACFALSGLYYVIYVVSKRQWIGFGDVKLGLVLALLLSSWQQAVLALFLANLIGTLLFLPLLLTGKVERQSHIPFGPLMIAGWAIAGIFGVYIIDWYVALTLGV